MALILQPFLLMDRCDHGWCSLGYGREHQLKNVRQIPADDDVSASITDDGYVVTLAAAGSGGDSSVVLNLMNVLLVQATTGNLSRCLAAFLDDGSVVTPLLLCQGQRRPCQDTRLRFHG